jgi:type II secretion system protein G
MRVSLLCVPALALTVAGAWFWLGPSASTQCGPYPQLDMGALGAMLAIYRCDTGRFPPSAESLDALVNPPVGAPTSWRKLLDEVPRDPWGSAFVYHFPAAENSERFELFSLGPDRVPSADDVRYRWRLPARERMPAAANNGSTSDTPRPQQPSACRTGLRARNFVLVILI